MYTGMFLPSGDIPPSIMQNGKQQQDVDLFISNQQTATMYMWRLLEIAMSVFKWNNLPKGVDERQLEFWLLRDGFCGFFYDEDLKTDTKRAPEGYAVLPMLIKGKWDIYNYPTDRTAYATNGLNYDCNEDNSIIIFNNYLRVPMWLTIQQFAYRLARCDRIIDINLEAQKTPKVIICNDKKRLTLLNLAKEVDEGKPWIFGDKNLDLECVQVFDTTAPYVSDKIEGLKHQYWNEALTYLGIENVNTEKKERLVTDEVMNNMGDVEAQRFVRLNARQQACEQINELFNLDVSCEFRTGMYIKADGYAARNLPTSGMRSDAGLSYDDLVKSGTGGYNV